MQDRLDARAWLALVAMGVSLLALTNDISAVNVAIPSVERDLDADVSSAQWAINGYALTFGVLIVTAGRLADVFGRRRIFFAGMAVFALTSLLGAWSPTMQVLIAARTLQGVGAALMFPAVIGIVYAILPERRAGLGGAIVIAASGAGQSMGPIVGGMLTEYLSWRWILLVNVPVAGFVILVTWLYVRPSARERVRQPMDYLGIATLSVGLVALLFALDQATGWGWRDPRIIVSLVLAGMLVAAFVVVEGRAGEHALVPGDVLRSRSFAASCVAIAAVTGVFFASLLYIPQFLQKILGASPLGAGAAMLPMMATFTVVSVFGGPLYERFGAKALATGGAGAIALGSFLVSAIARDAGYVAIVPGMAAIGLGIGLFFPAVTTAGVTSVRPERSSLAGGIIYMFNILGGAIGLGLTTTVFSTASQHRLTRDLARLGVHLSERRREAIHGLLAGTDSGRDAIAGVPPSLSHRVLADVRDAFVSGMKAGFRLNALLALVGTLVALAWITGRQKTAGQRSERPSPPPGR